MATAVLPAVGVGCPAFMSAAPVAGDAGKPVGFPRGIGAGPPLPVVRSDRLGDGLAEASKDGVSMRLDIPAASATGGQGAAWSTGIDCEVAVREFDDDAGAAAALVSIVVARSSNNFRSIQTSVLPAAFSSAARLPTRDMKSVKALRTPGEVGNALWTTCGQVFRALSSGGEKACPAAISRSIWCRSDPSSASACTAGTTGGSPESSLAAKAVTPINWIPAQTAIGSHAKPGLFRRPHGAFKSRQIRTQWDCLRKMSWSIF